MTDEDKIRFGLGRYVVVDENLNGQEIQYEDEEAKKTWLYRESYLITGTIDLDEANWFGRLSGRVSTLGIATIYYAYPKDPARKFAHNGLAKSSQPVLACEVNPEM